MKLEDLKKLCDEATPGPWEDCVQDKYGMFWQVDAPDHEDLKRSDGTYRPVAVDMRSGDAEFLAAARTYMPKLIAVAETIRLYHQRGWTLPDAAWMGEKVLEALAALEEP